MSLHLSPMTEDQFQDFLKLLIPDYAKENVEAGYWHADEALERSQKSMQALLPQGRETPHHSFYFVLDGDQRVGHVWFKANVETQIKSAFIFDIVIDEDQRGKGYGRQVMQLIEAQARELGLAKVALHVFAHNQVARHLYESLDYQVTSLNMVKQLG